MDDWGSPDDEEGEEEEAAVGLVGTGSAALVHLAPILADKTPVRLSGSEGAAFSEWHNYRRADYAFCFICKIMEVEIPFRSDPAERDLEIRLLQMKIREGKLESLKGRGRKGPA
jgi:hypothetical protein